MDLGRPHGVVRRGIVQPRLDCSSSGQSLFRILRDARRALRGCDAVSHFLGVVVEPWNPNRCSMNADL